jgi:hypothetical protein
LLSIVCTLVMGTTFASTSVSSSSEQGLVKPT